MGKTILKKTLMRSDAVKFLETGKTGLINGFVSSRTGRAFKAFLVLGEGGKLRVRPPRRKAHQSQNRSSSEDQAGGGQGRGVRHVLPSGPV